MAHTFKEGGLEGLCENVKFFIFLQYNRILGLYNSALVSGIFHDNTHLFLEFDFLYESLCCQLF